MKKSGVLFSGGKDSCYSAFLAKQAGYELTCLISVFSENPESYMFHTPNIKLVKYQAEVMNLPLIIQKTKGEKEFELKDLEKAIKKAKTRFDIDTIITGALASNYQASRIKAICDKLNLTCFNPIWNKDEEKYWKELLENKFEIIISGVASYGLEEKWLGKIIDKKMLNELKQLKEKFKFHLAFEGGEAETFVINCPLFRKKLRITKGKNIWEGNNGKYDIKKIKLIDK